MNARAMTTLRLPRSLLADLKAHAARERKSLNRFLLEMAEDFLKRPPPKRKTPKEDPISGITRLTWAGPSDLSERHDDYLHGPIRKP